MDMDILQEYMGMLSQFKNFSLFKELNGVIQKLEDKIYRGQSEQSPIIHLDKNENLKGLHFIDQLYQAILKKVVLTIDYQSFKARSSQPIILHPYILKEFNNRWFLVGRKEQTETIMTLALDRILDIKMELTIDYDDRQFDADLHYKNTIGVTVSDDKSLYDIVLKVDRKNAPYVLTKPFHSSQQLVERLTEGSIVISLRVHNNFEFQRLILGYGAGIEVLAPTRIRRQIKKIVTEAASRYGS